MRQTCNTKVCFAFQMIVDPDTGPWLVKRIEEAALYGKTPCADIEYYEDEGAAVITSDGEGDVNALIDLIEAVQHQFGDPRPVMFTFASINERMAPGDVLADGVYIQDGKTRFICLKAELADLRALITGEDE